MPLSPHCFPRKFITFTRRIIPTKWGTSRTPSLLLPGSHLYSPLFLSKVGIFLPPKRDLTVQGLDAPFAREWPLIWVEEPSYTNSVCLQLSRSRSQQFPTRTEQRIETFPKSIDAVKRASRVPLFAEYIMPLSPHCFPRKFITFTRRIIPTKRGTSRTPSLLPGSHLYSPSLSKVGIFLPPKRDLTVQGLDAPFAREWPLIWVQEPSYTNSVCLQLR
ncbi:hypothetical protein CDAR_112401 [Caerostris darwini]|uniref:Uncharacterized protein n=1 Tax=Caerostris darwini TaxID=1538125 RepID=A0AAV4PYW0_9ARAC|nr:hypothetical protein CDAR_112401 [Caerostris darwini]